MKIATNNRTSQLGSLINNSYSYVYDCDRPLNVSPAEKGISPFEILSVSSYFQRRYSFGLLANFSPSTPHDYTLQHE
jgi:hypothetical protein